MWTQSLDAFLIFWYRLPENAVVGFYLGTSVLAVMSVVIGELTLGLALLVNAREVAHQSTEMNRMHNLSVEALELGHQEGYKACNKAANDAFGKSFFTQIAMGAGMLWPIPLALYWMGLRFRTVSFKLPISLPLVGDAVTYPFLFLLLYILARIGFKQVRNRLPVFSAIQRRLHQRFEKVPPMKPFPGLEGSSGSSGRETSPR
jgi:hypothetical protein